MAVKPGKTQDKRARAVAGIVLVLVIALLVGGALARFFGVFQPTVPVSVVSDRAGLVMDRDAKVRARGVEIGRVADISRENGKAVLHLDLDPELIRSVPANASA
ncbi:MlaD family protein, partial [Dietzia sp.]|uniref:MlaD family protein n=1 Tax=Dietzia sp. TaxID=1871616 RepID=UPI002FD8EAD5